MARDNKSMKRDSGIAPETALPQWSFERPLASLRILTEFGVEHGASAQALLAGTGIAEERLADASSTATGRQELCLMRNLAERLGHVPALGIEAGKRYHFTAFGALGLALASSPTLRSALELGQRFSELTFGFARVLVEDTRREVRVTIDDSAIPDDLQRFVVECTSAVMLSVGRDLLPAGAPLVQVALRYPPPLNAASYERFYGMKPVFRSPTNLLVLDRKRLDRPLPLANAHALSLSENECRRLLERGRRRSAVAARVRDRLETRLQRLPGMDEVADELHLTARTLRRRLQDEGTTFVELRDEVRMMRAEQLLAGPRLSLERIAEHLGYAGATSFVNAFKRSRGLTPHRFRLDNA
jgi:AraC-like DNA-binding protein